MKKTILVLVALLATQSFAETIAPRFSERVDVIDPDHRYLKSLVHQPELIVDHVSHLGYEVYGPRGLKNYLQSRGVEFTLDGPHSEKNSGTLAEYPSPEEIIAKMAALRKKYPTFLSLIEIGKSVEGRPLVFARVTAPANSRKVLDSRPKFKYIANMHGDEIVGREMMVSLIEDLASNYGKDSQVTRLMDSVQIYIMPSMNPDGANRKTRFNANGVDLNRTFPDFTTSDHTNTAGSREPEVKAVMAFQAKNDFKLSANFHGGSEVVNYPWDTTADPHPLDNFVKKISFDYAKNVPYLANSREFKDGITNGYAWYEVDGGMQDWSYYWYKDLQVTIELSTKKWPDYSEVQKRYRANRKSLLNYIENVLQMK